MILGLDVSTSMCGWTILDDFGKLIDVGYINFKKCEDFYEKLKLFKQFFKNCTHVNGIPASNNAQQCLKIYVEEPLMAFGAGFSSSQTIRKITEI